MKKLLITLPIFALFLSCQSNSSADSYGSEYTAGSPVTLAEEQEKAKELEEDAVYSPVDYNDGLLAEITLVNVKFSAILDLDERDVPRPEMLKCIQESIAEADKVREALSKIEPFGVGGEKFKNAALDVVITAKPLFQLYLDFVDLLSVPDADWSTEDANRFDNEYSVVYQPYSDAYDSFVDTQDEYAAANNFTFGYTVDAEEVYNESKEKE